MRAVPAPLRRRPRRPRQLTDEGRFAIYEYRARILKIVDADTVHLEVDLGFDVRRKDSFRLYGINAPEMSTPEGVAATAFLKEVVTVGDTVTLRTEKDRREKYGRYLATILIGDVNVNALLVDSGHAAPYLP